jgi:hypothetical protein
MKLLITGLFTLGLILTFTSSIKAESLMVVNAEGEASWNVLAAEVYKLDIPQRDFNLGYIAADSTGGSPISIKKDGEKISLTGTDGKSVDATGWKKNLVELVETPDTQKIEIATSDGIFTIKQQEAVAQTSLPIKIDPKGRKLAIETPTGDKFLTILPLEAVQSALRAKVMNKITSNFEVVENENTLSYKIAGEKVLNLFNIYDLVVPVTAYVSASTGEILSLDQPPWLAIASYLLS